MHNTPDKLTDPQLGSQIPLYFFKPKSSLSCSLEPTTYSYPARVEFTAQPKRKFI